MSALPSGRSATSAGSSYCSSVSRTLESIRCHVGVERPRVGVVGLLRVHVEVRVRRSWMNSRSGSGGAPCSRTQASNASHSGAVRAVVLRAERRPLAAVVRPAARSTPAAMSSPGTSSGLHDTMRTNGAPGGDAAPGSATTLSSTMTSGCTRAMISRSCGSQ